jgi:hypothetical protein
MLPYLSTADLAGVLTPAPAPLQICLAAAASLAVLANWAAWVLSFLLPARAARAVAKLGSRAVLAAVSLLAVSRSTAQVLNYGAPLTIYRHLPEASRVHCTGALGGLERSFTMQGSILDTWQLFIAR